MTAIAIGPETAAAAQWFLAAALLLGAGLGWCWRLRLPVHPRGRLLPALAAALPPTPRQQRSTRSWRRILAGFSFALMLLAAAVGWLQLPAAGAAALLHSYPMLALPAAACMCGLLLVRFPLTVGLPLLLLVLVLGIWAVIHDSPLSPRSQLPQRVRIVPLSISDDMVRVEVAFGYGEAPDAVYHTVGIFELPGPALQLEWQAYRLSPWVPLLRSQAAVPAALHGGELPHDVSGAFDSRRAVRLHEPEQSGTTVPALLPTATEIQRSDAYFPRLLDTVVLEFPR